MKIMKVPIPIVASRPSCIHGLPFVWQDFKVLVSFFLGVVCCKTSDLGRWAQG